MASCCWASAELFRAEFGMQEQVHGERKDLVGIALERIPREGGGVFVARGLNVRGFGFEQIVEGVAVHFGCAAGAPGLSVETDEARLGGVLVARAAGNEDRAGDEGQFVIFLQEEDDAVLQLDAFGLLRLEFVQLGDGNFFPGLALLGGEGDGSKKSDADRSGDKGRLKTQRVDPSFSLERAWL